MASGKKNKKKRNSSFFKSILCIILIVGIVVGLFSLYHIIQKRMLVHENEIIWAKDFHADEFDFSLRTSGKYAVIEKEMKQYLQDISKLVQELDELKSGDQFVQVLTIENFKEDGPNFEKSFNKLESLRKKVHDSISKLREYCTDIYMNTLIQKHYFHSYYQSLFEELLYLDSNLENLQNIYDEVSHVVTFFEVLSSDCENILNFLKQNSGQWVIESNSIVFRTDALLEEYQKLSNKLLEDSNF